MSCLVLLPNVREAMLPLESISDEDFLLFPQRLVLLSFVVCLPKVSLEERVNKFRRNFLLEKKEKEKTTSALFSALFSRTPVS